eukprot:TRINITY_DN7310_c0_g1_i1.p1 TRINITY_DN7310_c0_g1~~TRINITY_DN7310_c0_g1_i1.p1  ORF type:complete len:117 (-),score=15.47 TRINITY_DN7310_c0_g1_i1:394-744(-)
MSSKSQTSAKRRLIRDFKKLRGDAGFGISASPIDKDIMHWHAVICGPVDSIWEGATFMLDLLFKEEYPNKAPTVKFISKVFHPNVYPDGNICLDILNTHWSPTYDVAAILTSIQCL